MKRLIVLSIIVCLCCTAAAQAPKSVALPQDSCFLAKVLSGKIYLSDRQISIGDLMWNPHATFKGVYLKHLILGKETNNQLSCHIVKIDPDCVLETHIHDGKMEIHEVVAGSGKFYLEGKEMDYSVGKIGVIPANVPHKVVAGKDGLYLFAKFTPALQ